MEPYLTLALTQGYRLISEAFYVGSEIADENVDSEVYAAINRAVVRAVADINRDVRPFLHHFVDEVPGELGSITEADLQTWRLRYTDPAPYPQQEFEQTYRWLLRWGLIQDDPDFRHPGRQPVDPHRGRVSQRPLPTPVPCRRSARHRRALIAVGEPSAGSRPPSARVRATDRNDATAT